MNFSWKSPLKPGTWVLYYKHVTIVNDDSSIISKWSFKLIDDPRIVIYDYHRFIIQATGACAIKHYRSVMDGFCSKLACLFVQVSVLVQTSVFFQARRC
jgi:hypothetical protein